jgi:RimJ/RimL family protein N-acetyltransferase
VGFKKEGVLRQEVFRQGRALDILRMGLLDTEIS